MAPRSGGTPQASGSLHKFLRRSGSTNRGAARRGSAQLFASLGSGRERGEVYEDGDATSGEGGGSATAAVESLVEKQRPWPERFAPGDVAELAG